MSRLKVGLVVCLFLLALGTTAQSSTPQNYLVSIELQEREDLPFLLQDGINVVQNFGDFVLARVGLSEIAFLTSAGFSVQTLDSDWGYSNHYIVSMQRCPDPSTIGKVVYSDSDIAVVRRSILLPFEPLGHDTKRVRTSPIRLRKRPGRTYGFRPDTLPDPLIQEMVDSVSTDTLESYLRSLQGIGTRYSPTLGCSLAADYIRSNMEAAGLTAVLQPYGLSAMAYDLCCVSDSVAWAVDETGGIYKSEDGGVTWQEKHKHQMPLLGVFFLDSLLGWSVGIDTILHTTDGGENWYAQASTGAIEMFSCVFVDSLHGWASAASPDTTPAVYRTTDGGDSWLCSDLPFAGEFLGISFIDTLRGWTTGVNSQTGSGIIYVTTDGGATWSEQLDTTAVVFFDVTFFDSQKGWAAGGDRNSGDAVLMATTDGGQTWSQQITGGYLLADVDFVDSLNGWCVGFATIRRTTDGGATWIPQFAPAFEFFFSVDMLNTLHGLFCGGGGTVCYTFDSGTNWLLSSTGGLFLWYNVEAELLGVDLPDEIYIICGHHDDTSEDPMSNAPGADDNGSGTAGVLEAGRILSNYQFHRTIKFVTFSGEEQGLLGSAAYAARADSLGENIMGVLNLDMIGYLDEANQDLEVVCDLPSEWMADTILQFSTAYVPSLIPYKEVDPGMVGSDHASFWDLGYSAVLHIERAFIHWNPYYHSTGDTVGTLDLPYVTSMVKLAVASVAELADPYVVGIEETYASATASGRLVLSVAGSPFSDRVTLRIINSMSPVASLKIYDSSGRLVREFDPVQSAVKTLMWKCLTDAGSPVSSGVYFVRLQSGQEAVSEKIVLVK